MSNFWTSPDLSVSITEEEAQYAWDLWHIFDWSAIEDGLPAGAKDTSGQPIDRHNGNLQMFIMGSLAVTKRVGPEQSVAEAERLLDNPQFRTLVRALLHAYRTAHWTSS